MKHHAEEKHPKQDFQVERIAFFSDAVYAIAVTLLVIEFRPPHIEKGESVAEIWQKVLDMKYLFGAVVFSFILIINYWMRHHLLFKHIHNYNRQIVIANMATLFPIIFFPFSNAFFYEGYHLSNEAMVVPFRLTLLNNILAGVSMYYFYWLVMKKHKEFSYPMPAEERKEFEGKLIVMAISFSLVLLLSFISLEASVWGVLPMGVYNLYTKYFSKKKSTLKKHA
ncbi:MAG: TMEM175 family protein [Ferruginibacter sp.]